MQSWNIPLTLCLAGCALMSGCSPSGPERAERRATVSIQEKLQKYTTVRLTADLSGLSEKETQMLRVLMEAAQLMDDIFWMQAFPGDRENLLSSIPDAGTRRFVEINYGPWDRLEGNEPFVEGFGPKPPGANFYPSDMTRREFEAALTEGAGADALRSLYTLVRRDAGGALKAVPYHEAYREEVALASLKLGQAAELAEEPGLRHYLEARAQALLNDQYQASDFAWLDMKENTIDIVIGPIETYEDQLFGYKAAHEAYILIKDKEWSRRLERYATFLPELQRGLPVPDRYKQEEPGSESDLNAYDVIFYAGDCNAGSKTIAINLPNDEEVQLRKGTRRLQLKNAMRAKFDEILVPIADLLIARDQRPHISFDAFFANTMFHEVAHGLGIKNTVNDRGTVREALKELASAIEEGKADILGLYMVTVLQRRGEMGAADLRDNYVTFLAGMFRSVRFGTSSAHARANLVRFNFFKDYGAFERVQETGTYRVDFERMEEAMDALSETLLRFQGEGDYDGVAAFMDQNGQVDPLLRRDLERVAAAGIPVDVVFEQGPSVLGLSR